MINRRQKTRILQIIALVLVAYIASFYQADNEEQTTRHNSIQTLFADKKSDVQLQVSGKVVKILPNDSHGSRHQRFIIDVGQHQTLLIAHNIDLAPSVADLQRGDEITLYGEYEWNENGGVLHWTHHDPQNRHPHGWIRHNGQLYQ